jgi:hypothetical protein
VSDLAEWTGSLSSFGALLVAGWAALIGIETFKHQRTSYDVQMALTLFDKINFYWDRCVDGDGKDYEYNIGQILAYFETASMLFNKRILTKQAAPILKDHIIESFCALRSSEDGAELIAQCCSSSRTFEELKEFLNEHQPTALQATSRALERSMTY